MISLSSLYPSTLHSPTPVPALPPVVPIFEGSKPGMCLRETCHLVYMHKVSGSPFKPKALVS